MRHKLFLRRQGSEGHVISGKLLRYLSYAVGEVVLIIVGILFALKINDWNEDRKAQVEFDEYIVQLKEDVRTAIGNVKISNDQLDIQKTRCEFVLNFLTLSSYDTEELADFEDGLTTLGNYSELQVNVGLLGQLLNGDMDIISRNQFIARKALEMESSVELRLDNLGHVYNQLDLAANNLNQFRGKGGISAEVAPLYDMDAILSSGEFAYTTQTIIARMRGIVGHSAFIVEELQDFLTVLEEYE